MRQNLPLLGTILVVTALLAAHESAALDTNLGRRSPTDQPGPVKVAEARTIRTNAPGGFFNLLFGPLLPSHGAAPRYDSEPAGSYRTLCVRMCDGYYWPMNFSTSQGGFKRDQQRCQSSCSSPAKLFVHRNPGGDVDTMRDLTGKPYSKLPNAFRYRKEYVETCRCKPEPWSEAAQAVYKEREIAAREDVEINTVATAAAPPPPKAQARKPVVGRWRVRDRRPARKAPVQPRRWWSGLE